jgi:hypothetical protein
MVRGAAEFFPYSPSRVVFPAWFAPVLGLPVTTLFWLPSVKSRGHVYPLSFLP